MNKGKVEFEQSPNGSSCRAECSCDAEGEKIKSEDSSHLQKQESAIPVLLWGTFIFLSNSHYF